MQGVFFCEINKMLQLQQLEIDLIGFSIGLYIISIHGYEDGKVLKF